MVRAIHSLAHQALTVNQQLTAHLIRIRSGFLPGKQVQEAQNTIQTLQEMLRDMQKALDAPPQTFVPAKNFVPLK